VIEKAYKKLRLDALVIQQGRLVENTKSVNKEDLLNMVRYGAERVFSSEAANITEEDIDALIAKGEAATKELNDKLQSFTNDAMRFTMDGGMSAYEFEEEKPGEEGDADLAKVEQLKALMGANWVDPPKRERKRVASYAENEFYRIALQKREYGPRNTGPKLPKMPPLQASAPGGWGWQRTLQAVRPPACRPAWLRLCPAGWALTGAGARLPAQARVCCRLGAPSRPAGLPVLQHPPPHRAVREGERVRGAQALAGTGERGRRGRGGRCGPPLAALPNSGAR
jgi:hypothetical protein